MDLLDTLLGGRGCSTDGSMTRNPITSIVDSVFNSHVAAGQHQQPGMYNEEQGFFMEEPLYKQENASFGSEFSARAPMAAAVDMGNQMPGMSNNQMFGGPQMWQQQQFMMMQQQAAMSQMMQMQSHRAMMQENMRNEEFHSQNEKLSAQDDYQNEQYDNGEYEDARLRSYVAERAPQIPSSSTQGLGRALEQALNEGELSSHRMDEIWSSFGAELTENDPNYAATDAPDWSAERDRQQQVYEHSTDTTQIRHDGQSLEGYRKAWENLSAKLEAGKDDYLFQPNNKYLSDASKGETPDLFSEGMRLFKEGKIREAVTAFEAEAQRDSTNSEAWRMLGTCHAENDEDKKAIVSLRRSVEEDPYNIDSLLALGTSYVNELDSVRALECLRSWVTHNPLFQGLKVEADEYSDGSQIDEVMQLMLAVAAHAPSNPEAQVVLGVLYNISQDFDNATECFSRAIELSPPDYTLLNKMGATLANNNKSDQAVQIYVKALNARPTYARGWLNLGISFANMNQYEEAAKAYVQALHLTPSAKHIWGYLRVVFTSMDRLDLSELSSLENTQSLADKLGIQLIHPH